MAKHIGLIGGIGPAATVVYYRALVRLHAAAGQPLALTIAHADLGALIADLEAKHRDYLDATGAGLIARSIG